VAERWEQMLNSEARIISSQPPGTRMHSGAVPSPGTPGEG
jgi:hypothetical protein